MPRRSKKFPARDLAPVTPAEAFADPREPAFSLGNLVRLNSGGPLMLLVDLPDEATATVAYRGAGGRITECTLPQPCLHRARDLI